MKTWFLQERFCRFLENKERTGAPRVAQTGFMLRPWAASQKSERCSGKFSLFPPLAAVEFVAQRIFYMPARPALADSKRLAEAFFQKGWKNLTRPASSP